MILFFVVAFLWITNAVLVGFVADSKGRPAAGWGLLAFIFGPLVLLAVGLAEPAWERNRARQTRGETSAPRLATDQK